VKDILAKISELVKRYRGRLWTGLWVLLAAWSAYNIGLIQAREGGKPLQEAAIFRASTTLPPQKATTSTTPQQDKSDLRVVASKSSTGKKYHYIWCSGYKTIKPANQIWFASAQLAESAGYTLAGNCKP